MEDVMKNAKIGTIADIAETLDEIYAQLRKAFDLYREYPRLKKSLDRWAPDTTYDGFKEDVIGLLDDGNTARDWDIEHRISCSSHHGDYYLIPLLLATAYCVESQRALEGENREKALYLVNRARNISEWASKETIRGERNRLETSRKGGLGRAGKYDLIKVEVVKFLNSPPVGGWGNELETRQAIKLHLEIFEKRRRTMAPSKVMLQTAGDMLATLRRWFKHDLSIRAAYAANCSASFTTIGK